MPADVSRYLEKRGIGAGIVAQTNSAPHKFEEALLGFTDGLKLDQTSVPDRARLPDRAVLLMLDSFLEPRDIELCGILERFHFALNTYHTSALRNTKRSCRQLCTRNL